MKFSVLTLSFAFSLATILISCADQDSLDVTTFEPSKHLDEAAQSEFMYSISRYICHLPKRATNANRFEARWDSSYRKGASAYDLVYYYPEAESGYVYFAVKRIAPSIKLKYVATAGRFKPTESDPLSEYQEVFRTWKMEEVDLNPKLEMLFVKFIKGEDLTPYYTENSKGQEYIEFPNEEVWYNRDERRWETSREDLLEPYRKPFEHITDAEEETDQI